MKFLPSQLAYLVTAGKERRNLAALGKYLAFLAVLILVYSVIFHWIMWEIEGQRHSWLTGLYWVLTVMSTLGFGDITFQSDIGRGFSVFVLMSGVILLLIVLPFAFIRFFYAPWLEARIRSRAPRAAPDSLSNHVIICAFNDIARSLIERFRLDGISTLVLEPDPTAAATLHDDGFPVMTGDIDNVETFLAAGSERARAVVANLDDSTNTNITLTVREAAPHVPLLALVENEESEDILELVGATTLLPLKRRLGEQLANRVSAGTTQTHVIGRFKDLLIAEFPVHNTPLAGCAVRDTSLRESTGVSIVGIWQRGRMEPVTPDTILTEYSVPVVAGTADQIEELDEKLVIYNINFNPVVVLGGGKVGRAAAVTLGAKGLPVHIVDKIGSLEPTLQPLADKVIIGDAADRLVLEKAGIATAPSILITSNDDATNIYLAAYCKRLNPDARIISRITRERNIESIHRAGADFVLSYDSLAVESVMAILRGRELVMPGIGVALHELEVPSSLDGKTLAESDLGARCGINIVAIENETGATRSAPNASTALRKGDHLLTLCTREQRDTFMELFGAGS